jgi:large subunit ribosomal protein L15
MAMLKRPAGAVKSKKRLGRGPGTGNGTTAGKGTKGQNARSGGGVRPGFEGGQMPLYRRIARRGFSNYPFKKQVVNIDLSTLEKLFANGETVTVDSLIERRAVRQDTKYVKILANGELSRKLTISGIGLSAGARAKVESAGGTIEGDAGAAPAAATEAKTETDAQAEEKEDK